MYFFRCFLLWSLVALTALGRSTAVAEDGSEKVKDETDIFISDLQLSKDSFSGGEAVPGVLKLVNMSGLSATEITVKIGLAGAVGENAGMRIYDSWTVPEKYNLKENEEKLISFSYPVPLKAAGEEEFSLLARGFLKSGMPLGWQAVPVKFAGESGASGIRLEEADLVIGERHYGLQEGPTVRKGKVPTLQLYLTSFSEAQKPEAMLRIFRRDEAESKKLYEISVSPLRTGSSPAEIPLPVFEYAPGLYSGVVELVAGQKRLSSLNFRYIIEGDQASIDAVTASRQAVRKGEKFEVTVRHSGPPIDIDTELPAGKAQGELSVSIKNPQGDPVAHASVPFDEKKTRTTLELLAERDAESLIADVKIINGSTVLAELESFLSPETTVTKKTGDYMIAWIVALMGVLILITAAILLKNKKFSRTQQISVVLLTALISIANHAGAYTRTEEEGSMVDLTGVTVKRANGNLFARGSMAGGATFYVEGNILANNCRNAMYTDVHLSVTNKPNGQTQSIAPYKAAQIGGGSCTDENHTSRWGSVRIYRSGRGGFGVSCHHYESSKTFRVGPFTAPPAVQGDRTYRVELLTRMTGFHHANLYEKGYVNYVVRGLPPANCTGPDGAVIGHGKSRIYFNKPSVPFGQACSSENRTCNNGVLSGSFKSPTCSINPPLNCTGPDGATIVHGAKKTYYKASIVDAGQVCEPEDRVCNNGVLSGTFAAPSCAIKPTAVVTSSSASPFIGDKITITWNSTNTTGCDAVKGPGFSTAGLKSGNDQSDALQSAGPQTFEILCKGPGGQITAGVSVTVTAAVDCVGPDGVSIKHGSSKVYYQNPVEPFGGACKPETRVCTNGALSGSFSAPACYVEPPKDCKGPDNVTIPHNSSRTYYLAPVVPFGSTCTPEARICINGKLSGSYTNAACTVTPPLNCIGPDGVTIISGTSRMYYHQPVVAPGVSCNPENRACLNGVLSGSASATSCVHYCVGPDGAQIAHGSSRTYYFSPTAPAGGVCASENRVCNDGSLSGSAAYASCSAAVTNKVLLR